MIQFAFSLIALLAVEANEPPPTLSQFRELAAHYLEQTDNPQNLFSIGQQIATLYFKNADEKERIQIEAELGAILRANRKLGAKLIPLGNAFHTEAEILNEEREAREARIKIVVAGATTVVGVLALQGAIQLKFIPPFMASHRAITLIGGGLVAAGVGYFLIGSVMSWALLPYDEAAKTAEAFLDRYPGGEDFLKEAADPTWKDPLEGLEEN